jgi:adenosylcobinamide-GDP ribazoletransferase
MRSFRAALAFLTRIPLPLPSGENYPSQAATVPWYPLVGALVGAVVGGSVAGLVHVVPAFVAATVGVLLGVIVTGAFHEDGLADIADAFAGGWTPEQRMRILKDPLHGSYGVAALCGSIVLRIACVTALGFSPAAAFACVVAAHALGRAGAVGLMVAVPAARADGLGAESARTLRRGTAVLGLVSAVAIAALATGWWAGPFVVAALVGAAVIGWWAMRKIGGVSGDVLGAAEQVVECLVLVSATALATRHRVWWA